MEGLIHFSALDETKDKNYRVSQKKLLTECCYAREKQDHWIDRYHCRLLDYQSPYFQLNIEKLGPSYSWGSSNSFELLKSIYFHLKWSSNFIRPTRPIGASWQHPANILRTTKRTFRKHQEDIYRIYRENPKTSVIIWKHLWTPENIWAHLEDNW